MAQMLMDRSLVQVSTGCLLHPKAEEGDGSWSGLSSSFKFLLLFFYPHPKTIFSLLFRERKGERETLMRERSID